MQFTTSPPFLLFSLPIFVSALALTPTPTPEPPIPTPVPTTKTTTTRRTSYGPGTTVTTLWNHGMPYEVTHTVDPIPTRLPCEDWDCTTFFTTCTGEVWRLCQHSAVFLLLMSMGSIKREARARGLVKKLEVEGKTGE
ncbi:hypothetical protein F4778DRAFT_784593 [Xylariomycetidae sp. FL2044]|nr:hypothetical protein F4778DRAFT_784593 [Xylariomycetidae sp. FL2044]